MNAEAHDSLVIVFRTTLKPGFDDVLTEMGMRMYLLAKDMPGFLSYKDFSAADGENLSLIEFDSEEHLAAWRHHPEHLAAEQAGKEKYFASYHIQVCKVIRRYGTDSV